MASVASPTRSAGALALAVREAFLPRGISGGAFQRIARSLYRVRVLVGVSAIGVSWALPRATVSQRLTFVLLVGLVYLPYALFLLLISRRNEGPAVRFAGVAGDLAIVFLFQAVLPQTRIVALFGYLLILAFYSYLGGPAAGFVVGTLAMILTITAEVVFPSPPGLDLYTLTMYAAVLISMTFLINVVTREQRNLTSRLEEAGAGLREAQQIARLGSWEWDIVSNRVSWSEEMYRVYGYDPPEFEVDFEKAMERVASEDVPRIRANLESAFRRGEDHDVPAIDFRIGLPSGESRFLRGSGRVMFDRSGRPLRMVGTVQDVTEQEAGQRALREAYDLEREAAARLRELDELKNTFLSAVSHDLRTPLTSVLGFARTLEQKWSQIPGDKALDLLRRIISNAERLERMVLDLLDLDRLSRGLVRPERSRVDLALLVRKVAMSLDLRPHPVHLDLIDLDAFVDATQVERVLENLLVNAGRHTPPEASIWVRVRHVAGGVVIIVDDDGPGVPDHLKQSIFEAFRQGPEKNSSGTGIGLSLVRRFADLHGGRAWVQDREGGGASFRVLLPDRQLAEIPAVVSDSA